MPMRTMRPPWEPSRPARARIARATPSPTPRAKRLTTMPDQPHRRIATTAAALEPLVTPMTSGLASWLRSIVWEARPPMPRAAPARRAMRTRGSRSSPIAKAAPGASRPVRTAKTSVTAYQRSPQARSTAARTRRARRSAVPTRRRRASRRARPARMESARGAGASSGASCAPVRASRTATFIGRPPSRGGRRGRGSGLR